MGDSFSVVARRKAGREIPLPAFSFIPVFLINWMVSLSFHNSGASRREVP